MIENKEIIDEIIPYSSKYEIVNDAIRYHWCIISKSSEVLYQILKISNELVFLNDAAYTYLEFLEKFNWYIGQPCGKVKSNQ